MSLTTIVAVLASPDIHARVGAALLEQAVGVIAANPATGTPDQQRIRLFATNVIDVTSVAVAPVVAHGVVRYLCATDTDFQSQAPNALSDGEITDAVAAFYTSAAAIRYVTSTFILGQ